MQTCKRVGATVALTVVAVVAVWSARWAGLTWADIASWVQALGSIGAIAGAFALANRQARRDQAVRLQEAQDAELKRARVIVALGIEAYKAVEFSTGVFIGHEAGRKFAAETDHLQDAQSSLSAALVSGTPESMIVPLLRLKRILTYAERAVRQRRGKTTHLAATSIESAERRVSQAKSIALELAHLRNALIQGSPPARH